MHVEGAGYSTRSYVLAWIIIPLFLIIGVDTYSLYHSALRSRLQQPMIVRWLQRHMRWATRCAMNAVNSVCPYHWPCSRFTRRSSPDAITTGSVPQAGN